MAPVVDGLEQQYQGKVAVRRINANTDPTAQTFNIRGVPTFIFLDIDGKEIGRIEGGNQVGLEAGFRAAAKQ